MYKVVVVARRIDDAKVSYWRSWSKFPGNFPMRNNDYYIVEE